jgi:valyl-tRNA synthetase
MLYNEQNNMERLSENLYRKLNENIKEYHMIKQLLEKKNNIEDQQDKREFETLEKTVTTLLRSRHDEDIKIDLGFFKHYGNFKSKLYFKQSLLSFIDRYIKEGEMFAGEYISSDDINYMKEIIKEYD